MTIEKSPVRDRLKQLYVHTSQGEAGVLTRESQLVFGYRTDNPDCEISLTMPLRAQTYAANILPGVLRQNLPEGFLLYWLNDHFRKTMKMDDFNMLALIGADTIGRVRTTIDASLPQAGKPEDLASLIAWRGSESLFEYLAEKYASTSGISGVQPKVLLSAATRSQDSMERGVIKSRNLIVKASGAEYEGLAENEFHCMSIARAAGLDVPAFWLSENKEVFIIERFDFDRASEQYQGFEDMTALTGKQNVEKYDSSYENIAKAIRIFCNGPDRLTSLVAFFDALVLSIVVRNGDAHLKNFGLLYTTPKAGNTRLSPLYDVVCTTTYLPKDTLALKLNKSKRWPTRDELIAFGQAHCLLDRPADRIDRIVAAALEYRPSFETGSIWDLVHTQIAHGTQSIAA